LTIDTDTTVPPGSALPSDALDALLAEIAEGAAVRERDRIPPFEQVRAIGDAGLGALRVPVADGGPGATLRELFAFVVRLADADSNIAQSLRAHFHFVEGRIAAADEAQRERWFPQVLAGKLFGNGTVERTTKEIFGFETALTPAPEGGDGAGGAGGHLLNGTKYYSTGSLYCDWIVVGARLPDATIVSAVVPVDREGVVLEDDWDGMGQRLTASGTSRFTDVRVADDELLASGIGKPTTVPRSAFLQLYLVAVAAGIARAVATDAARVARGRSRSFGHASAELPKDDPLVQRVVGQISAYAFAAEHAVLAAADALDVAAASRDDASVHAAAVAAAQAQVVAAELVPRAAELLFDAGGASATARDVDLDRHWRNARTLASHNAAMYKARAIGDLLINGQTLPTSGFF
jgi:alkylation response protein AidB-like acyl-CoA dehydrogenase